MKSRPFHLLAEHASPMRRKLDCSTKNNGLQFGIELSMIKDAYREMVKLPAIELQRFAPIAEQDSIIMAVADRCGLTRKMAAVCYGSESSNSSLEARIVVAGCSWDAETRCTCEVLRSMVQANMNVTTAVAHTPTDAKTHLASADYFLPVLTKGLLQDAGFASVLLSFEQSRLEQPVDIVTVLADSNFAFPSPEFYQDLEGKGDEGPRLATAFRRMINILALPFSPAGSIGIMNTQVGEIGRRFRLCREPQKKLYTVVMPKQGEQANVNKAPKTERLAAIWQIL